MYLPGITHSEAHVRGAGTETAIPVLGILSTSVILAVITTPIAGGAAVGRNPAAFVAADGEIESASIDTSTMHVHLIYVR